MLNFRRKSAFVTHQLVCAGAECRDEVGRSRDFSLGEYAAVGKMVGVVVVGARRFDERMHIRPGVGDIVARVVTDVTVKDLDTVE